MRSVMLAVPLQQIIKDLNICHATCTLSVYRLHNNVGKESGVFTHHGLYMDYFYNHDFQDCVIQQLPCFILLCAVFIRGHIQILVQYLLKLMTSLDCFNACINIHIYYLHLSSKCLFGGWLFFIHNYRRIKMIYVLLY